MGLTAVHCASTILTASLRPAPGSSTPSPVLQHAAVYLIPQFTTYLADAAVASASDEQSVQVDGVKEVVKALVGWCSGLNDDLKPRAYGVLLPTLCLLLDPSSSGGSPSQLHLIATTTLLGLAQSGPKAFKDATAQMGEGERAGLEKAVRDAVGAQGAAKAAAAAAGADKRGIELKSFG